MLFESPIILSENSFIDQLFTKLFSMKTISLCVFTVITIISCVFTVITINIVYVYCNYHKYNQAQRLQGILHQFSRLTIKRNKFCSMSCCGHEKYFDFAFKITHTWLSLNLPVKFIVHVML